VQWHGTHAERRGVRVTQAEIERIAEQIARAPIEPPPDDPRDDILAARHELPPAHKDPVIAALLRATLGCAITHSVGRTWESDHEVQRQLFHGATPLGRDGEVGRPTCRRRSGQSIRSVHQVSPRRGLARARR
jgi:hypothetical protein